MCGVYIYMYVSAVCVCVLTMRIYLRIFRAFHACFMMNTRAFSRNVVYIIHIYIYTHVYFYYYYQTHQKNDKIVERFEGD